MEITEKQADVLLRWMASAAVAAAEDETERTAWRIDQFQQGTKELMAQFNEADE